MKLLTATFEVPNDLAEHRLRNVLEGLNCKYIKTHPDTEHLKEDKVYLDLVKQKKIAEKSLYDYVDSKRK